jgi:hypothetical protein
MLQRWKLYVQGNMSGGTALRKARAWCERTYGPEPDSLGHIPFKIRLGVRLFFGKRGGKAMASFIKQLKRWGPVIGSAIVAGAVVLRALGKEDWAKALETAGGLLGVLPETAATVALAGVTLKVVSQIQKARKGE